MQTWAIANQKGGVGKTTTTLCLGRALAGSGAEVLLVDLDPHASLTRAFGIPAEPAPSGTHDLFDPAGPGIATLARPTPIEGLSVVAGQPALATLERRGASQPGLGMALARALGQVGDRYQHALLDCPPTLGLLMVNALAAADRLLVPTQTDPLALHGLAEMLRTADMIERSRRRPLPRQVLPTLYDKRTRVAQQSLDQLRDQHGPLVWPGVVPMDTRLRDVVAIAAGQGGGGRGLDAYADALSWLLGREMPRQEAA